jgi:hypothetical protein
VEKKSEDYRKPAGEGFIPYMTIFFAIGERIGKLLKLLLVAIQFLLRTGRGDCSVD